MIAHDYGRDLERRILYNGVYTALKRKEDKFREDGENRWGLLEWVMSPEEEAEMHSILEGL